VIILNPDPEPPTDSEGIREAWIILETIQFDGDPPPSIEIKTADELRACTTPE
jgi:hypothetical protein